MFPLLYLDLSLDESNLEGLVQWWWSTRV